MKYYIRKTAHAWQLVNPRNGASLGTYLTRPEAAAALREWVALVGRYANGRGSEHE